MPRAACFAPVPETTLLACVVEFTQTPNAGKEKLGSQLYPQTMSDSQCATSDATKYVPNLLIYISYTITFF